MANEYKKIGQGGVILTRNKFSPDEGSLQNAQNAELVLDKAKGGRFSLRKRGGVVSSGTAFGFGVFEMFQVKFINDIVPDVTPPADDKFRPISDQSVSLWTTSPLWSKLNETVADDANFVTGTSNLAVAVMPLTAFPTVAAPSAGTVRVRARYPGASAALTVNIKDNGVTVMGSTFLVTGSFVTYSLDIFTDLFYDGVTVLDWSTLELEIGLSPFAGNQVDVSWFEMELTP